MSGTQALSVRQPWAELIIAGKKLIELRTWNTPYRGEMWLHAGRDADLAASQYFGLGDLFTGGYIGRIVLTAVVGIKPEWWLQWRHFHLAPGEYVPGRYAWFCSEPLRFLHPIPGPGKPKLFRPEPAIHLLLEAEASESARLL